MRSESGLTLVELVVSMVIVSIALAGVLVAMNQTTVRSADPMIEHQAVAIAEAYLEEILLQAYADPDDAAICGTPEGSRALYDDVCDYAGLSDSGARDQTDTAVAGLESYQVDVTIDTAANLNGLSGSSEVLRADVTVTHPANVTITLSGYRAL